MTYARLLAQIALCCGFLAGWLAPAALAQDDMGQICMFRCAPQLGSASYDQCLSECFGDGDGTELAGGGNADVSPLLGFWQADHTPCGHPSDDSWHIDASGASPYESFCEFESVSRDGDEFTLVQQCTFYEDEVAQLSVQVQLLGGNAIAVEGTRYVRCDRP